MENPISLEDFYKNKFDWMPDNLKKELGHFNVFVLEPFLGDKAKPLPYKRRDFYKITLVKGSSKVHYADQVVVVNKQALTFTNPLIPYKWEDLDQIKKGVFCIFNTQFFHQFGNLNQYSVFQPKGKHIFELTNEQVEAIDQIYKRMMEEIDSDYIYKYDVLRNLVFELLHFAMKMEPSASIENRNLNASERISSLFLELLERQFPIDEAHQKIQVRTPADFADQLNVHVNHLNRAVKTVTQKTTTQLINQRVVEEAKILLKHSLWSVGDIGFALGFHEGAHFNSFFKKQTAISPLQYRKI